GVQVLVDNKRVLDGKNQPVDGTPAVVSLSPGSYVLTVQREGYVPSNEQVEIKAGERLTVRAKLEPLASTGFTLVSEPPGATAEPKERPEKPVKAARALPPPPPPEKAKPAPAPKKTSSESDDDDDSNLPPPTKSKPAAPAPKPAPPPPAPKPAPVVAAKPAAGG